MASCELELRTAAAEVVENALLVLDMGVDVKWQDNMKPE